MDIFARPWWLLLLPAAAGAIAWAERAMHHPGRRAARVVLRGVVAVALTLAAAGLRLPGGAGRPACVFVLDGSESMGDLLQVTRAYEDALDALPPETPRAVVTFAAEARVKMGFRDPDRAPLFALLIHGGTDIASGLRAALGLLPRGAPGAIALVSDGRATRGDALAAALECGARRVPVYALVPGGADPPDVRIESLSAPAVVEEGKPVPLVAVVSGTRSGPVDVTVRKWPGGGRIRRAQVDIVAGGYARAMFSVLPSRAGVVRYEAEVRWAEGQAEGKGKREDAFGGNNSARTAVMVRGRPKVLVVSDGGVTAEMLGRPEFRGRFEVESIKPGDLVGPSASADSLAGYAAVILENVGGKDIDLTAEKALAGYVERGGGLLVTGGPRAFGAGGWRDDEPLPEILPVRMSPGPGERTLLVILIDASGSMAMGGSPGRSKIEDAREAVAAVVRSRELGPADEIALVAFRSEARLIAGPMPVREKDALLERLAGLTAEGKTSLAAPLRKGLELLRASPAKKKVALLLSDGEPTVEHSREELISLAREFRRPGLAFGVLGTNPSEVHKALLRALAEAAGGSAVFESDYTKLDETLRRMVGERAGRYVLRGPVAVWGTGERSYVLEGTGEFPSLGALNRTKLKPRARGILSAAGGEPVLALWPVGPGRAAAFTSAPGGSWAGRFADWPGRARFVSQLLRELVPPPPEKGVSLRAVRDADAGGRPAVEIVAKDESGRPRNLLDIDIELWSPELVAPVAPGRPKRIAAGQVGLGRYLARVPSSLVAVRATRVQTLLARVLVKDAGGEREVLRAPVTLPPGRELMSIGTDRGALGRIARASGGRLIADAGELASALESVRGREFRDAAPYLAASALLLVIVELVARALRGRPARGRSAGGGRPAAGRDASL